MSETVPDRLPLFPLGTVLFPGMLMPLHIFEERYRRMLRDFAGADPIFGVVLTRLGREVADQPEIHAVGTAASLIGAGRYDDGRTDLVVQGGRRFRVDRQDWSAGYLVAAVTWLDEDGEPASASNEMTSLVARIGRAYEQFLAAIEHQSDVTIVRDDLGDDPAALAFALCSRLPVDPAERQRLLEEQTTSERLRQLLAILRRERALLLETGAGGATLAHPGRRFSAN